MTVTRQFEGKNVKMAVSAACQALDIAKEALDYTVISHGSTGIFGLVGVKKAKISVHLPQETALKEGKETAPQGGSDDAVADADRPSPDGYRAVPEIQDPEAVKDGLCGSDAAGVGKEALMRIAGAISSDAEICVEDSNGRVSLQVQGGDAGLLIGKRGQTLEAIQYLVEKIVNKNNEKRVRVQVDVEGYLQNRRANLKDLALKMADKTKKTGKPATIGQMNAHDRRIVHLALKDDKMIRTQSVGDGFLRKLVIFPKKAFKKRKRGS